MRLVKSKIFFLFISFNIRDFFVIVLMANLTRRNLPKFINNSIHMARQTIFASMILIFQFQNIIWFLDLLFKHSMLIMMVQLILMNFFWLFRLQVKVTLINVLALLLICKFINYLLYIISLIYRYDISNDGQIDQKELTKLITAMVEF